MLVKRKVSNNTCGPSWDICNDFRSACRIKVCKIKNESCRNKRIKFWFLHLSPRAPFLPSLFTECGSFRRLQSSSNDMERRLVAMHNLQSSACSRLRELLISVFHCVHQGSGFGFECWNVERRACSFVYAENPGKQQQWRFQKFNKQDKLWASCQSRPSWKFPSFLYLLFCSYNCRYFFACFLDLNCTCH